MNEENEINFRYLSDILNSQAENSKNRIIFSDLHIRTNKPIFIRKNGDLEKHKDIILNKEQVLSIIKEIIEYKYEDLTEKEKELLLFELTNKSKELDLSIELPMKDNEKPIYRARLNIFKSNGDYGIVFRVIPKNIKGLNELNIYREQMEKIKSSLRKKEGLILVTGQTGSGKSTTLAAMLDFINSNMKKHIITIEDPVEFYHNDKESLITHREVGEHSDTKTFASGIRASLREDPDVILIGEMRDSETALSAIQAAQTGHIVLATLHTNTAAETILRLIDMFPSEKENAIKNSISNSLLIVLSQKLVKNINGNYLLVYEMLSNTSSIKNLFVKKDKFHNAAILDAMRVKQDNDDGMITLNQCLAKRINENNDELKISEENACSISYDIDDLKSNLVKKVSNMNDTKENIVTELNNKWDDN